MPQRFAFEGGGSRFSPRTPRSWWAFHAIATRYCRISSLSLVPQSWVTPQSTASAHQAVRALGWQGVAVSSHHELLTLLKNSMYFLHWLILQEENQGSNVKSKRKAEFVLSPASCLTFILHRLYIYRYIDGPTWLPFLRRFSGCSTWGKGLWSRHHSLSTPFILCLWTIWRLLV